MQPLTPWAAHWADTVLPDGTPVWQSKELGNDALIAALTENATEVINAVIPNENEAQRKFQIESMVGNVFANVVPNTPEWFWDNVKGWDFVLEISLDFFQRRFPSYIAPSEDTLSRWYDEVHRPMPLAGTAEAVRDPSITGVLKPLTPWTAHWVDAVLADGTPIWESDRYGNAALLQAIRYNATQIVGTLFPYTTREYRAALTEDFINAVFSHPDRVEWSYDNPRQLVDALLKSLPEWTKLVGYVRPPESLITEWADAVYESRPPVGYIAAKEQADRPASQPVTQPVDGAEEPSVTPHDFDAKNPFSYLTDPKGDESSSNQSGLAIAAAVAVLLLSNRN